jgi:xanthine dehydrogenase accessory factor
LPPDLTAVIVASHGHDEEAVLSAALHAEIPYIALVASPRRGAAVLAALPVPEPQRARVHTPAGLDIGARTAPEIAVSIYAELIASHQPPALPRLVDPAPPVSEAVDPVCGMTIPVTDTTMSLSHHYFCGPGCHQAFADDPSRYASRD